MVKQIQMMQLREEAIADILEKLSSLTKKFNKPKLILIGGYALRAFVDISRYTRDCDFAVREKCLEDIKDYLNELSVVVFHQEKDHGYLRMLKLLKAGVSIKLSVDFMQGQIVGRIEEDKIIIDRKFVQNSKRKKIKICEREIEVFIPSYTDYLVLKIASARPSDIRDIATLIWKNGIPDNLKDRVKEIVFNPEIFFNNIKDIIKVMKDKRFLDSWRGTFLIKDFTEEHKIGVIRELKEFIKTLET